MVIIQAVLDPNLMPPLVGKFVFVYKPLVDPELKITQPDLIRAMAEHPAPIMINTVLYSVDAETVQVVVRPTH